jgi:uncharacterized protein (DUF1697 family)
MPVIISMLRGVNLGAHNRMSMEALRDVYESLKLLDVRTFIQSGNVLFKTEEREIDTLVTKVQDAIERRFKFRPDIIVRTAAELRDVIARNPFARRRGIEPAKLLVTFLASHPGEAAREQLRKLKTDPEEVRIDGREIYTYFPNGMARPKLSWAAIEKILKTSGTGRNWNSVTKMLEMAEAMEAS